MHYPLLTKLLYLVYSAVNSHKCVQNIDSALSAGDHQPYTYGYHRVN